MRALVRHWALVMEMRTYFPMISESAMEASAQHFTWVYVGNFFSSTKIGSIQLQAPQIVSKSGLAAVPIRLVEPVPQPANNGEFVSKPTKVKKTKLSAKGSNQTSNILRPKKPKKKPSASLKTRGQIKPEANVERKNLDFVFDEANFDFSGVPPPYCSCTGVARGCYRWGAGGWQSSCCKAIVSEYPLPMSALRARVRVAGRNISDGAYRKLLYRLATEGHDLSQPVDLKNRWAKHGTNKFVTIKDFMFLVRYGHVIPVL